MQSKFTYHAYVHLLCFFLTILVLYVNVTTEQEFNSKSLYIIPILLIVNLYVVFNRYRTKIISVYIDDEIISIKRFCGLGRESVYQLNKLEGYQASKSAGKYSRYNYIFIINNGKKVAKISDKYHSNYEEISQQIYHNLKGLGFRQSNIFT